MCDKEYQVLQICLWVQIKKKEQCLYLWSTSSGFPQLEEQAEMTVTCNERS